MIRSAEAKARRRERMRTWKQDNAERVAAYQKSWNAANREGNRLRMRRYSAEKPDVVQGGRRRRALADPVRHIAKTLVGGVVTRCRRRGLSSDPEMRSVSYVAEWLRRTPNCECCGGRFDLKPLTGRSPASASIDRFDPARGYTKSNCKLLCYGCNALKRDATLEQIETLAAWMRSQIMEIDNAG